MKTLIIFSFLFFSSSFAQTPYNDALRFSKINITELEQIHSIISNPNFFPSSSVQKMIIKESDMQSIKRLIAYLKDPINSVNSISDIISYSEEIDILNNVGAILEKISKIVKDEDKKRIKEILSDKITQLKNLKKELESINTLTFDYSKSYTLIYGDNNYKGLTTLDNTDNLATLKSKIDYEITKTVDDQDKNEEIINSILYLGSIKNEEYKEKKEIKQKDYSLYFQDKKDIKEINTEIKTEQSLSGINEAVLIQALADFIAKKIQENAVNDLKNIIFKDNFENFRTIFPRSYNVINNFKLKDISNTARKAIFDDLKDLLKNISSKNFDYKKIFGNDMTVEIIISYIRIANNLIEKLDSKTHPIELFYQIGKDVESFQVLDPTQINNLKKFLAIIDILQESIRVYDENEKNNIWANYKQFQTLKPSEQRLFVSKMYALIKNSDLASSVLNAEDFLKNFQGDDASFVQKFKKLSDEIYEYTKIFNDLEPLLASLSNEKTSDNSLTFVLDYFDKVSKIFSKSSDRIQISNILKLLSGVNTNEVTSYCKIVEKTIELSKSLKDGKFISSIPAIMEIAQDMGVDISKEPVFSAFRVLDIYVELVNSKSSDEMQLVIEKAANLSGGHFGKINAESKGSPFYINAYGGITLGPEFTIKENSTSFIFGITAPVGIEWVFSSESASGLYLPLIDLGSVLTFRFNGDENVPNTLTLKQIVAPGLYYKFSPTEKSAFTILIGGGWVPALREVNKDGLTFRDNTIRVGISFTYDIPLVRF